jgi:SAM-dependent methyltransferase
VQSFTDTADIDTASDAYAQRFAGAVGAYLLEVQAQAVLELLAPYPGARVLDVGGGHGQTLRPLRQRGFRAVLVGSNLPAHSRLARLGPPGSYAYAAAGLLQLPFADRSFEAVLCLRLISHMVHWRELIGEVCRVAKHAVILDYPEKRSLNLLGDALFRWKLAAERTTRRYRSFHRSELVHEFASHGFVDPTACPEFFLPMVLHRILGKRSVSARLEGVSRAVGATLRLGSPVVLRLTRPDAGSRYG